MTKVILNPKHFKIRVKPEDGTIWLTHEKHLQPIRPISDITNEIMFALCADLSAEDGTELIERSIRFSDGFNCKITVALEKE